jgi:hypothetical protein
MYFKINVQAISGFISEDTSYMTSPAPFPFLSSAIMKYHLPIHA